MTKGLFLSLSLIFKIKFKKKQNLAAEILFSCAFNCLKRFDIKNTNI